MKRFCRGNAFAASLWRCPRYLDSFFQSPHPDLLQFTPATVSTIMKGNWKAEIVTHRRGFSSTETTSEAVIRCQIEAPACSLITPAEASPVVPTIGWQETPASGFLARRILPLARGQPCTVHLFLKIACHYYYFYQKRNKNVMNIFLFVNSNTSSTKKVPNCSKRLGRMRHR